MSLSDDFNKMINEEERAVAEMVANLEGELIRRTPVDTGQLKASWDTKKLSDNSYVLTSNMQYADVIFNGRRQVPSKLGNMMWIGSVQMPDGVAPILQEYNNELDKRLKMIKA